MGNRRGCLEPCRSGRRGTGHGALSSRENWRDAARLVHVVDGPSYVVVSHTDQRPLNVHAAVTRGKISQVQIAAFRHTFAAQVEGVNNARLAVQCAIGEISEFLVARCEPEA